MAYELELPGFYVDAIVLSESVVTPVLTDREPESLQTNVPIDTNIALEITDVGSDGIDESKTKVWVAGSLAFDGGVFQTGFDGGGSASTAPDSDTRRIVIDPTSDFSSQQIVDVRVVSEVNGGAYSIDETYSFTIEDLTAPQVVGASSKALNRVRVGFNEPVLQVSASGAGDALNPSNYVISRLSAPAVDVSVSSVVSATDSALELITDIDMSPGAQYQVTVSNVEDLNENAIGLVNNSATFTVLSLPFPASRRFDLWKFIPLLNRQEDVTEDLWKFISVLQEPTNLLLYDIDKWIEILDPDFAPDPILDLMLLDLGNPFSFDLVEIDKRRLLRVLVAIYRQKGTDIGIVNAVRFFLGIECRVVQFAAEEMLILGESELGEDWILGPTASFNLYAFDVEVDEVLSAETRKRLRDIVNYMRPAHTHFVNLVEPTPPVVIDHLELGESELGFNWELH